MAVIFFLAGGLLASFAARVPAVQERFGLSEGALGLAFLTLEAGAVIGLPLGGALCARAGSRRALRVGFVVYPVGLAAIAWSPFEALFACALGTSLVDVAMNVQGVERERRTGRRVLSRLHAAHSLGVLAGGLGGTLAAALAIPVTAHLAAVAALGLAMGQVATSRALAEPRGEGPAFALPRGPLLGLGALAFCAFLVDGAANNWSAVHVRAVGGSQAQSAAGFAAFASALVAGRLAGDRFANLRASGALATCGALICVLAPGPWVALAGWAIVGLGVATVAPALMRAAGPSPAAIAAVTSIGYLGSFTGPPLIGGLASLSGIGAALVVVVAAAAAIVALASRARMRA